MVDSNTSSRIVATGGFVGDITGDVTGNINGITQTAVETVTGAGAISISVAHTNLVTTGANALTLAAPGTVTMPFLKTIHMTTDGGDGTLASTNIVGQSSGTTSITFNDAGDYLVLVAIPGKNKWSVVKEGGVTAA